MAQLQGRFFFFFAFNVYNITRIDLVTDYMMESGTGFPKLSWKYEIVLNFPLVPCEQWQ